MSSDLPAGWREARLGDIAVLFNGKASGSGGTWLRTFKTRHVYDGFLRLSEPVFAPDDRATRVPRETYLRPGDTLTPNMAHGTIGRVSYVRSAEENWTVDGQIMVIRPKDPSLLARYLYDWMSRPESKRFLVNLEKGGAFDELRGQTHIYRDDVAALRVLLPPLNEQREIAAILSSIDDASEATQAVIDQLHIVKKALMAELLTRGLPGRHTRFKHTEIGEVPADWSTATYGELAANVPGAIQSGPFGSALRHSEFQPEGRLVIGIDNVRDGLFSLGSNNRISEAKFHNLERFRARPGDLLITVMATIGRCCVVPDDIEPAIITKHVYRLVVDRERANPYFLMHCLYGVPRLAEAVRGSAQGLTRPGLNKSLLLPLRFPLPPLAEQEQIVSSLGSIDERIAQECSHREALGVLKAAIMAVLLAGEVRVNVDEAAA